MGLINWLETHRLPCPVKHFLHIDCPGCGLQRSFAELLRGHLFASFRFHPVTIPLLLFFLFALLHFYFKFKKGNAVIIYSYIFISIMVLSNYVYKIIYHQLT